MLDALVGLIIGLFFALISMVGGALLGEAASVAIFGIGAIIYFPIINGIIGFIGGALMALLYNLIAGWIGGIEVELT